MMKQKKIVSMIGVLVVIIGAVALITGCPNKPAEYTKEDFVLKFKNESGQKCYVEIHGWSYSTETVIANGENWESSFDFPPVLKTEIPVGGEKNITVKDVVVSEKTSKRIKPYNQHFMILVVSDSPMYSGKWHNFDSKSKTQYTEGTFHIKLEGNTFTVDFTN
ncbi:hypothetical protein [Treponema pedis]|uniref:hypothetical protein n=1 Tax=Treponema pedis TaxID=409322 RepID=UPI00197D6E89|nr:hypothetical protein [Treponema pedis]QSI03996.1 hypothetical protein DYQ05_03190 [Treponema pedis]